MGEFSWEEALPPHSLCCLYPLPAWAATRGKRVVGGLLGASEGLKPTELYLVEVSTNPPAYRPRGPPSFKPCLSILWL